MLLTLRPAFGLVALLPAALLALTIGPAYGAASTVWSEQTDQFSDIASDECRGVNGTLTGNVDLAIHDVGTFDNAGIATGSHLMITETDVLHFEFTDGSFGAGEAVSRFVVNSTDQSGAFTLTRPHLDSVTVYAADGERLERPMFHEVVHVAMRDGDVKIDVDRSHFSRSC